MFNKLFKRSALKVSTALIASTVGLLALVFLGFEFGVFQKFIPNDATLLSFLGFIALMFAWSLFAGIARGRKVDRERQALHLVEDLLADGKRSQTAKVQALLAGKVFADAGLEKTRVARFFAGIARAKEVNPAYFVDIDRHIEMLNDNLHNDIAGLAEGASSQTKYGFIGTLVGIIIGLATFDVGAVQGSAAEAATVLGVLMTGIGIAVLTTVVGLVGATILRKVYFYLEGESIGVVTRLKELVMGDVEPVLNATATSGMVKVRLDTVTHGNNPVTPINGAGGQPSGTPNPGGDDNAS